MPGYAEDYEGYAFDPAAAKEMLAEAGFADGFTTELYVMNVDPNPRIAQAIQQDLKEIGVTVQPEPVQPALTVGNDIATSRAMGRTSP